jgi:hypothetical protein
MKDFQQLAQFERWVTIPQLWEADPTVLLNFGSLVNLDKNLPNAPRRTVRCSLQLVAFIEHFTDYKKTPAGPRPDAALLH